jgi:CheY-like chemotaxis protein
MEKTASRQFDLPALLKLGCPDIRMASKNNPAMCIDEYYHSLSKFLSNAPNIIKTLNKIAILEGDKIDFQIVANTEMLLRSIGCNKFMQTIDDIVKSGKMGHYEFSALYAEKLSEDMQELYIRTKTAEKKQEAKPDGEAANAGNQNLPAPLAGKIPLSKTVALMEQEEATRKMRVLAIDDSPVMLQTIASILSDNYTVYRMINPTMLKKFLEQITPELFLLDYKMPILSGFDLIPIIRNFEEHKNTPIVFLTSEGTSDHVSAALTLGARDFIIKPFQPETLREKVARHIVRKNLLQIKAA